MSISPPSDLVLDVIQAVKPSQYHASVAKLQSSRSAKTTLASNANVAFDHFATTQQLDKMRQPVVVKAATHKPQEAYRKFESLMLQNFINAMFTDEAPATFGQGAGSDYWKSMMIDSIADEMSQAGGIGIADMMEDQNSVRDLAQKSATSNIVTSANILVHKSQRDLIRQLNKDI